MTRNNTKEKQGRPWTPYHGCNNGCECNRLNPERMEKVLSHIFLHGRIPRGATTFEHKVVVGAKLAVPKANGHTSAPVWQLTFRGEGVLLDLLPD